MVTNKKFTTADKSKLDGLPTGATLNSNLAGKAAATHTHSIANVATLQSALDGKVASTTVSALWTGTQAQYDAISPKNNRTIYMIQG